MALIRPVVEVFQEFANPTVEPATPDLNCLVVGPAYWIQDYPADKATMEIADYGTLEAPNPYTPPASPSTPVNFPGNVVGALVDTASVSVVFDQAHMIIVGGTDGVTSNDANTFSASSGSFLSGANKVVPGDRIILTDTHVSPRTVVMTIASVVSATALTFTADLPSSSNFTAGSTTGWRVERTLLNQTIDSGFVVVASNQISIDGSVTLTVPGQGTKDVAYAKVYVAYRSLRQDLQDVHTLSNENEIIATLGRIDPRNPLALGAFVALENTSTSVQAYGVSSNDVLGHTSCRDAISARRDIYAIVPLTTASTVLAMWKAHVEAAALVDDTNGNPQRFRVVLGSGVLPLEKILVQDDSTGATQTVSGTAGSDVIMFTIPGIDFTTLTGANIVVPGDKIIISADTAGTSRDGTYTITEIHSTNCVEVAETIPGTATAADATIVIKDSTQTLTKVSSTPITGLASALEDNLYLQLQDPAGTFVSSGVIPGDIVEMMPNPTTAPGDFTGADQFVVASVISENRLRIVNNGRDTATTVNELPHGIARGTNVLIPSTATLHYQIVRKLDKQGQVNELIATAQSYKSRRVVLVWPDSVLLPDISARQPGYYLSCAVGGMTAGLPSHQGFTNLGIAGVQQIFNANGYFTDTQMTQISQGGWYVFNQETPTSLPFTIHQLTTDPSTLETGEYSVVKNFDFVSLFFSDILQEFLGQYNVNDDLLGFIHGALQTGIDTLRLRRFAKIGAPLVSGSINSVAVSALSGDRVVVSMDVGLPKPLNVIELHLIA